MCPIGNVYFKETAFPKSTTGFIYGIPFPLAIRVKRASIEQRYLLGLIPSVRNAFLLMLKQYNLFLESFQFTCKNYKGNTNEADIAKVMGFESNDEYNEIMFLREITHTVNAFNDMADIIRLYSKKPEAAEQRLENLLSEVLYEDSESV